jgi:hypothetical protein
VYLAQIVSISTSGLNVDSESVLDDSDLLKVSRPFEGDEKCQMNLVVSHVSIFGVGLPI